MYSTPPLSHVTIGDVSPGQLAWTLTTISSAARRRPSHRKHLSNTVAASLNDPPAPSRRALLKHRCHVAHACEATLLVLRRYSTTNRRGPLNIYIRPSLALRTLVTLTCLTTPSPLFHAVSGRELDRKTSCTPPSCTVLVYHMAAKSHSSPHLTNHSRSHTPSRTAAV